MTRWGDYLYDLEKERPDIVRRRTYTAFLGGNDRKGKSKAEKRKEPPHVFFNVSTLSYILYVARKEKD